MEEDKPNTSQLIKKHRKSPLVSRSPGAIFTGDGKLLIQLKNTNAEQEFSDGDPIDHKGNNNQMRVCPQCNKEFSSGKALGGHMRIHVPVKKTEHRSESTTTINHQNKENPTCSLCAKNFPSMKSLFGHMRCHPEREWRGIQPPAPAVRNSPSSSVSDDDRIDLMQSLTGWSITGRRGRRATAPPSAPSSLEEDEKFHNAAGELLLLAQIDSIGSNITEKQIDEEPEATNSNSNLKNGEIEDPNSVYRSKKRIIEGFAVRERRDSPVKNMRVDETEFAKKSWDLYTDVDSTKSCSEDEFSYRYSENTRVKKRKKMKLTVDLTSFSPINRNPFDSPDKYKCSTCNKCFPTHQALGGHRSSHNKFKITTINTIDESSSAAAATYQEDYQNNKGNNLSSCAIITHQCKICNKTFNTGQALGGHKRCHWTGPVEAPSGQAESAGEASQPSRRALEFDLNEVPTMEDNDHAAGCGYDYALSSYNSNNISC